MNGGIDSAISHSGYSTTVSKANWNLEELIFLEGRNSKNPEENGPLERERKPTTNLRFCLAELHHHCLTDLVKQQAF